MGALSGDCGWVGLNDVRIELDVHTRVTVHTWSRCASHKGLAFCGAAAAERIEEAQQQHRNRPPMGPLAAPRRSKTNTQLVMPLTSQMAKKDRSKGRDAVTREYTINLHKKLHSIKFKSRAPRAIKEIKSFATKIMKTKDVRIDTSLNKLVWSQGIKNVPHKLRIVISRRRNDDEEAKVRSGGW